MQTITLGILKVGEKNRCRYLEITPEIMRARLFVPCSNFLNERDFGKGKEEGEEGGREERRQGKEEEGKGQKEKKKGKREKTRQGKEEDKEDRRNSRKKRRNK
jgi:hypothetical protein